MEREEHPASDDAEALEPSPADMHRMLDVVGRRVIEHIATLDSQDASDPEHGAPPMPPVDLPETPVGLEELLEELFGRRIPRSINTASPGHLSYVPNGGLFHGALADFIVAATNRFATYWAVAPELAQLESDVIRWLARVVGLGPESFGVLTSGGSMANLSAIVTARHAMLGEQFSDGVLYVSAQSHHSVRKAAAIAGFPLTRIRSVPTGPAFRMRVDVLAEMVREDAAAGLRPFLVVGTAGTTNTGSVDDLQALASFCAHQQLWFHVDAAYGGFFNLTQRGRLILEGLHGADSVVLDPHKGLFAPFGTGCLLVRDVDALRAAHAHRPNCVSEEVRTSGLNFADLSPEMTRELRGLRIWLPLRMLGISRFARALDEKLDLAAEAARSVAAMPDVEMVAPPVLSTFAFRIRDTDGSGARTLAVIDAINARKRVHVASVTLDERPVVRVCVLSVRTHGEHLARFLEDLRHALETTP